MSSTAEQLDWLDEKINISERLGCTLTVGLIQDIRNAVFRDAERAEAERAEIQQVARAVRAER